MRTFSILRKGIFGALMLSLLFNTACQKSENVEVEPQRIPQAFPGIEGSPVDFVINSDTISCRLINNEYVFQGDILLTEEQLIINKGTGTALLSKRWPDGIIYYTINSNLSEIKEHIFEAISDYETKTALQFIERTDQKNYVEFTNSIVFNTCSRLGMVGGHQHIWLDPTWNTTFEIIHEIGHTVGLIHEHSRPDRDEYITIYRENIWPTAWADYGKVRQSIVTKKFDFSSVMIYASFNSSTITDNLPAMLINSGYYGTSNEINPSSKLSNLDVEMINTLYGGEGPNADFIANNTSILKGDYVRFYDRSLNSPTIWFWDFGDQEVSYDRNPVHQYKFSGVFTVSLKVTNDYDSDTKSIENFITVEYIPPEYSNSAIPNIEPSWIEVYFTQNLANIEPAESAFSVMVNSVCRGVNSIKFSGGSSLALVLESPIYFGDIVTITYNQPATNPLQTELGDLVPSFSNQPVTNNVTTTNPGIIFNPNLTYGSVSDIDGNVYKTVQIGTQTWMAENLRTTKFNDGTPITLGVELNEWINKSGAYCWYDYNLQNKQYGALYTWYAVSTERLCPIGWHVPDYSEWSKLIFDKDGNRIPQGKLKEVGVNHWRPPNSDANNETGFTALPGGLLDINYMNHGPTFTGLYRSAYFWSSSTYPIDPTFLAYCCVWYDEDFEFSPTLGGLYFSNGMSVRCIKD